MSVEDEDDDFRVETILYDEPRSLTAEERALVVRLVEETSFPELREQLQTVRAIGSCSCGCPTVMLETGGPAIPPEAMAAYNAPAAAEFGVQPREDWVQVQAWVPNGKGGLVDVILHVPGGKMSELEIWTGDPKHPQTDIPNPTLLDFDPDFEQYD